MAHSNYIKRVSLKRPAIAVLCCLVVCCAGSIARAQSGRRVQKRPPVSAAPVQEATPETKPPVAKAEKAQLTLLVCMNDRDPFVASRYLAEAVRNVFVQRIGQASSIRVITGEEMSRPEAVKRAKAKEDIYVVLLQLDSDAADTRGTYVDPSRLVVRYAVFTPLTGKTKLEGRVYQQQYRVGRGGIGLPSPRQSNPNYSDYLLKEAAREAANRVLEAFSTQTPRDPGLTFSSVN